MTLGWGFFYGKNRKFWFQKNSIQICIFNCNKCILVRLYRCLYQKNGCRQKLEYKHYNGKKQTEGEGALRIWNFQGYWRNSKWIFQGLIKNNVECSGHDQGKIMWNFQESWFYVLKFLKGVTQLCGVSRGEALFCLKFPRVK